ncbi:MAG: hypothetical protein KIT27_07250 [Legionellales bacterium]|nr:hypothetical protein [Legionellales bacterium]
MVNQYTLDSIINDLHHNLTVITHEIKKILDCNNIEFDKEFMEKFTDTLSKVYWAKDHIEELKNHNTTSI